MTRRKLPCLVCLRPLPEAEEGEYHGRCAKSLFGTRSVPQLEVDPANLHLLGLEMAGHVSLSGIQRKIALSLERGTLRLLGTSDGGSFILEPATEEYPDLPQNEQLCMRLAKAVGLRTPVSGLVRLSDDSLAFLSRRFDRQGDRRLPMEDFCQLAQKLPREKYSGSYEQCAKLLRAYSDEWLADGAELFRLVLFSWWVGNNDLHLKNISLLGEGGRHRLSPCYDLISTRILGFGDTLALTIAGKHSPLCPADWIQLGQRLGLTDRSIAREVERLAERTLAALPLVDRVPMRADLVQRFLALLLERSGQLLELWEGAVAAVEKPTRPITEPLVPTGRTALEVVREVQRAFEGIELAPQDPLPGELRELEWLARAEGAIFSSHGPLGEDHERTVAAFRVLQRMRTIAAVLGGSLEIPGSKNVRKHLRHLALGADGMLPGQAGDHLYELEVAAALHVTGLFPEIRMAEADVEIVDGEGRVIAIECKRPRKRETLAANLETGIEQLASRGLAGCVVLSLAHLLPGNWIFADDLGVELGRARRSLEDLVTPLREDLERRFTAPADPLAAGSVLGAIFTADVVIGTYAPHLNGDVVRAHTITHVVTNPHLAKLHPLNDFIAAAIVMGTGRLQR